MKFLALALMVVAAQVSSAQQAAGDARRATQASRPPCSPIRSSDADASPVPLVHLGIQANKCNEFQTCADCLNPDASLGLNCGWCSPDPAQWANGTRATQCMDHTSRGWDCFHLYMHDGCVAGYVCDSEKGQCVLGNEGEGDTYANCEEDCSITPPPADQYACNATTLTCEVSTSGTTDQDACDSKCGDGTPDALVGLWRGLNVQTDFAIGEFELNFTSEAVTWGPYGSADQFTAKVTQLGGSLLKLTMGDDVKYATYSTPGWPTGPETRGLSIAIERDDTHAVPPSDTAEAMGDLNFDVFVMNGCNSWKGDSCDFTPAFVTEARRSLSLIPAAPIAPRTDTCNVYGDCNSCLDDPSGVCGWCDGVVVDTDGNIVCGDDGLGCCGGNDGFSHCNVTYRKECPVTCDWTDYQNPMCRPVTTAELNDDTVQKFENCDIVEQWGACSYTWGHYCNETAMQCATVASEAECEANPDCDPTDAVCDSSNCTTPAEPTYFFCDTDFGCQGPFNSSECDANPDCDTSVTSCNPSECSPTEYYTCDAESAQCSHHTGPFPDDGNYFNTSKDCDAECFSTDVSGVWRGVRVDSGFIGDEWDFAFGDLASGAGDVTYSSKLTGEKLVGTYSVGAPVVAESKEHTSVLTITLATGEVLTGLVNDEDTGPITKFMYLGLPLADGDVAETFDDAMDAKKQEFVLVACLDSLKFCDFSAADPTVA